MRLRGLLLLCVWGLTLPAWAVEVAGEITLVTGLGTSTARDGSIRKLIRGDEVYAGEIINSGPNSYVNIKFRDGALMLLRPNTRFSIEQYSFDGEAQPGDVAAQAAEIKAEAKPDETVAPATTTPETPEPPAPATETPPPKKTRAQAVPQRAFFRLVKGGFRTVTGLIGKANREDYRVNTPTATIGVRGTDWIIWVCDLACANDPVINAALKSAFGEDFDITASEVIGTLKGSIEVINTATGETRTVRKGEYILSTSQGDIPLPSEPPFIAKDKIPDPATCQ